jgi:hypothetical protein
MLEISMKRAMMQDDSKVCEKCGNVVGDVMGW